MTEPAAASDARTWPAWLDGSLLKLLAMRESLPHALLLRGHRGIGKGWLADRFAQSLLCEAPGPDGSACQRCDACGWYASGNHPDFRRVSPLTEEEGGSRSERARREIKVDQIRALAGFVGIGAHRAGHKLVLIEPAESMNAIAANALLKTLEEPAGDTVFLLVCGNAGALPATVRSRCVPFTVASPPPAQALAWLRQALPGEESMLAQWLALADGAPLRALAFADPAAASAYRLVVLAGDQIPENSVLKTAEGFATTPPTLWVPFLQSWIGDLGRVSAGAAPVRFPAQAPRLRTLGRLTSLPRIGEMAGWLNRQTPILEHPLNARLFAEEVWLRYESMFAAA